MNQDSSKKRTALIVGAGIGGLSAAIAIRKAGWQIKVFERATSPRELGFGLAVAPNAVVALQQLGIADVVIARGLSPLRARAEVRRPDGTVLKRVDFPAREALGGQMVIALRPALHGALLEAVGLDSITTGKEATGFTSGPDGVSVLFADGSSVDGDLLVGADGIHSMVRRQLHPDEKAARSSGISAVRGAVHGATKHLGDLFGVYYLAPGIEAVVVRASDTGIYWFLSLARENIPEGMHDARAVLQHMAPRFDATFRAVSSATDDLRFDELFDRDPIDSWGSHRVTLLGDAAHPMLPHTGQGAAQAMVDAVTLGRVLETGTDLNSALRAYEMERRDKTAALVEQGRRTARMMRNMNRVAGWLRESVLRAIPVTPLVKVFAHINKRAGTDISAGA